MTDIDRWTDDASGKAGNHPTWNANFDCSCCWGDMFWHVLNACLKTTFHPRAFLIWVHSWKLRWKPKMIFWWNLPSFMPRCAFLQRSLRRNLIRSKLCQGIDIFAEPRRSNGVSVGLVIPERSRLKSDVLEGLPTHQPAVFSPSISTRLAIDYQNYLRNAAGLSLSMVLCFPLSPYDSEVRLWWYLRRLRIWSTKYDLQNWIWHICYPIDDMWVTGKSLPVRFEFYQPQVASPILFMRGKPKHGQMQKAATKSANILAFG